MNALTLTDRACRTVLLGLALFGAISHVQLALGLEFSAAALPLALATSLVITAVRAPARAAGDRRAPRWLVAVAGLSILAATATVAYGALATPARQWDGVVAWELKADFLTTSPTLAQPFFASSEVFSHCRDYPLLQPLAIAAANRLLGDGAGRALFPLLLLVLAGTVGVAVRTSNARAWLAPVAAAAVVVTPYFVTPALGAADSGLAELFTTTGLAALGAGLVRRHAELLCSSCFLLPLVKPEGLVYAALPVAILWCLAERRLLAASLIGWSAAAALWLPLRASLASPDTPADSTLAWSAIAVLAVAVIASDAWLPRPPAAQRGRVLAAALAAPLLLAALPAVAAHAGGTFGAYLGDVDRPLARLPRLPAILLSGLAIAVGSGKFGLTFALPLLAVLGHRRTTRPPRDGLGLFVAAGLATLVAPFLLSPESDLEHHQRSSMARLVSHWVGAAWILTGARAGAAFLMPPAELNAASGTNPPAHPPPSRSPRA
jgi:hypothetical protein